MSGFRWRCGSNMIRGYDWSPRFFLRLASQAYRSRFWRSVATVSSGVAIGHIVVLLSMPILSRLFKPEEFGVLAIFASASAVLAIGATARYELPIVIARSNNTAKSLFQLCIFTAAGLATAILTSLVFFGSSVVSRLRVPDLEPYLYLIPLYVFLAGAMVSLNQWACRDAKFPLMAAGQTIRMTTMVVVQLLAGFAALGQGGLIFGLVSGHAVAVLIIFAMLQPRIKSAAPSRWRQWRRHIAVARSYARFPKFGLPQELINSVSQHLPNFILAAFFGPAIAGSYWIAARVLQVPATLLGNAVRQVFLKRIAEEMNEGTSATSTVLRVTFALFAAGSIFFLPVVIFGPTVFSFFLGEEWDVAGELARWMGVWMWAALSNIPAVSTMQAGGWQRQLLIYEIMLFLGRNISLIAFAASSDFVGAVASYSAVGAVFNFGLILYALMLILKRRSLEPKLMSDLSTHDARR